MASLRRFGPLPPFPRSLVKGPLAWLLVYRIGLALRCRPPRKTDSPIPRHRRAGVHHQPRPSPYEKDLGPDTLKVFQSMDRFYPDKSWQPTNDEWPAKGPAMQPRKRLRLTRSYQLNSGDVLCLSPALGCG